MSNLHIRSLGDIPASAWTLTAAQVRDLTASLSPTPGGGSISILTGTLGLALVHKGASISLKRSTEDAARRESLADLCAKVSSAITSLSSLADADSQAYQSYLAARSLPRATDAEMSARQASMEAELLRATQVPLTAATEMNRALEFAEAAVALSEKHLLSDIFAGALLIRAAIQAVLLTVDANVAGISDAGMRETLKKERIELESASIARGEAIAQAYQSRVSASADR
jgi:formiminotetrahydrofolate cyclodeaminase